MVKSTYYDTAFVSVFYPDFSDQCFVCRPRKGVFCKEDVKLGKRYKQKRFAHRSYRVIIYQLTELEKDS